MSPCQPQHIVVGVDGSLAARAAARWAIEHARSGDAVELVHAWLPGRSTSEVGFTDPDDDRAARHLVRHEIAHLEALAADRGVTLAGRAARGDPRQLLCRGDADLVVVGSAGRGALSRALLASVCSHLVRHGSVPVVIVPFRRHAPGIPATISAGEDAGG